MKSVIPTPHKQHSCTEGAPLNPHGYKSGYKPGKRFAMIMSAFLFAFIFAALKADPAFAVSLTATVDKTQARLEDTIVLRLSVEGARNTEEPILPRELKRDFNIQSRGSSSRVQILNGTINSGIDYNYMLSPRKTGTFTVGPPSVIIKGTKYESKPFTIQIFPAAQETDAFQDIFITSEVDKRDPYVNEQVLYTFRFYRAVQAVNPRLLDDITFAGFYTEKLGKEKEFTITRGGKEYLVTELQQAIFATEAGEIEIPPLRLQVEVMHRSKRSRFFNDPFFDDSFFGLRESKTKVLVAPAIPINVRPLPEKGRPLTFSNLIGDFTISSILAHNTLEAGDSVTLTITVSGCGNIWDAVEPELIAPEHLKVYSDKPTVEKSVSDGCIRGVMTLKKALVPLEEGTITIPPLKLAFFNTHLQEYQEMMTKPLLLNVLPSSEKENLHLVEAGGMTSGKQAVRVMGKDILPINSSLSALRDRRFDLFNLLYLLLFVISPVIYLTGLGIKRRTDRFANDRAFVRRSKAMGTFAKAQKKVASHLQDATPEEFYRLLSRAFKEFLGDKLNIVGSALTPQEAEKKLLAHNIDQQLSEEVRALLEKCETAQFSAASPASPERGVLLKRTKTCVKTLERRL